MITTVTNRTYLSFISVIIPTLNEAKNVAKQLACFDKLNDPNFEVILIDSPDSKDNLTIERYTFDVKYHKAKISGRANQLNEGANLAKGQILVFLHADVKPPISFLKEIRAEINNGHEFGFFAYRFEPSSFMLDFNASFTKKDGIFAGGGDQIHFMTRSLFEKMGGYDISFSIMEDFDFVRRIRKAQIPIKVIPSTAIVSSRKYKHNSWLRVNLMNLLAFLLFKMKFSPDKIKRLYYGMLKSPKG